MKSTKKRFAGGGEAEEKEAGLEASRGEKIGFLERLRMGNIDEPTSEAFKRLGAGRGASERASKVPVEDRVGVPVTKTVTKAPEDDSYDRLSEESAPVITDQYIGKPAPIKPPEQVVMPKRPAKPSVAEFKAVPPKRSAMGSMQGMPEPESKKPKDELADDYREALMERIRKSKSRKPEGTATNYRSVTERLKEQFGFKNGGAVSASRGDGIAQRGKTRGKYC